MKPYAKLAVPLLFCGLAACNGTPTNGLLPGSVYQLEQLNMAAPRGSAFTQALTANYRVFAQDERDEYDWNAQQIFAKKGLAAADGIAMPPESMEYWDISDGPAANDLRAARTRLMTMLNSDAPTRFPQWAANAQTNFDCWLHEQYEGWEFDKIAVCRGAFMNAMNLIYAPPKPVAAVEPAKLAPTADPSIFIVFFDFDKSDLSPEARKIIAGAARSITAGHLSKIKIDGYTDTSGTAAYNLRLSIRRGKAVEQELISDGIPAADIRIEGMGETGLLAKTPDGVREPQNRRATIDLMGR
jgi:OOP family OmpA-OmpF porin